MSTQEDKPESPSVTFVANLPATQNAIQFHGNGGMRILLDITETETIKAIDVIAWVGHNLKITIEKIPKRSFGHF